MSTLTSTSAPRTEWRPGQTGKEQPCVGQARVARHRMVYAMLEPLMRHHIHALALVTQAPGES